MVLHQHEAAEFRTEMAFNPVWQWCQDRPSVRRYPTFALVTGRAYRNHQVLHQKGFVTLEARTNRNFSLDHLLFNVHPWRDLARPGRRMSSPVSAGRSLVHAAWLDRGAPFQTFQTGDLFAQFYDGLLQGGDNTK